MVTVMVRIRVRARARVRASHGVIVRVGGYLHGEGLAGAGLAVCHHAHVLPLQHAAYCGRDLLVHLVRGWG